MKHSLPRCVPLLVSCLAAIGLAACTIVPGGAAKPSVVIVSPPSGSQYYEGEDVAVQSTATDATGVVRVELVVDGNVVRVDPSPTAQGQPNLTLVQTWKATAGVHTILVRAYNTTGAVSDPAGVSVNVLQQTAQAPTLMPTIPSVSPTTARGSECTDNAAFVTDVTVPDGTQVTPGQGFNKIWRLSNNGTCTWSTGYQFVFMSGEAMTASTAISVPPTAPGATADILVAMTAPSNAGSHSGTWRMRAPSGAVFGQSVSVRINVVGAPPAPPNSSSACSGTPSIAAFAATPGTINAGGSSTLSWGAVSNADSVEIDHGIGGVAAPGSTSVSPGSTTTYTLTAHCGSNTATLQATVTVNAPPPPASIGNFAGSWTILWGTMNIVQNGASVAGTYSRLQIHGDTFTGTVSGNTLTGNSHGDPIYLTLGSGGNTFDGYYHNTAENVNGKFCGARSGTPLPAGCSFSGTWSTTLANFPPCSMTLTQINNAVTGTYCNGTITGNIVNFTPDAAELSGLWHIGGAQGAITFYLLWYDGVQFQGNYDGSNEWCGWRAPASAAPSPCKRQ